MSVQIRPAELSDWQIIRDFNCALAEESESKALNLDTVSAGVRALLADDRKGRYFLAEVEGQVVGQLMHTYEWSDWRDGEIWWLQSVYVHPDFRRRGIFRQLFEHLKSAAQACPRVVGLRLYVEDHNARAIATYTGLGMQPAGYFVLEQMLRSGV